MTATGRWQTTQRSSPKRLATYLVYYMCPHYRTVTRLFCPLTVRLEGRRYDRGRFSGVSKPLISLVTKWAFFGGKPAGALESSEASAVAPGTKLGACCNEMRCALIRQSSEQKRRCRPRVQQVILGDHALSILNQINQQIENLRPDGDLLGTSPKLAPIDIQDVVLKENLHFDPPRVASAILRPSSVASAILSKNQADFKGQLSAVRMVD